MTIEHLNNLIHVFYLESSINESLRLSRSPLMTRKYQNLTRIDFNNGKSIRFEKDQTLLWFGVPTHFDSNLFPNPDQCIFDRFIHYEIKICLALILRSIEFQFQDEFKIPSSLSARIGFGIDPLSNDIQILYRYKNE